MADETTPVDFLPHLPPRTELEQLTAAYEAGLLTPALFALAKEKLLHPDVPAAALPPPPPLSPPPPPAPPTNEASSGELPSLMSFFTETPPVAPTSAPPAAPVPPPVPARVVPAPTPTPPPTQAVQEFAAAPAPVQPAPPTPKPAAPAVDWLGTSATPPAPAPTPPPNLLPGQRDVYADLLATEVPTPPPPGKPAAPGQPATPAPSRSVVPKLLLALGIVGLLLLIYWQVAGSHPDEQLTSPRPPAASGASAAPVAKPPSKRTKASRPKKRKVKKNNQALVPTDSAATPTPPLRASTPKRKPASLAQTAAPVEAAVAPVAAEAPPRAVPAAPEAGDTEAISQIRSTMAGYYADMLAPPFAAAQHFAPRVQRLYIQQNLTPADIDASFNRNFFPDNKRAVLQIEPGTLRVSAPAADGTRMATFVEASRVYHPSRQAYQRLRAQVRARFDADYKLVYLRQERLLESTVEQ